MINTDTPRTDACPHPSIVQFEQGDKITTQCTKCGKKMRVVKKPKCSCYGGFDCEVCNPDYYEEMKTTDTPRTDAKVSALGHFVPSDFARELERENVLLTNRCNALSCVVITATDDINKQLAEIANLRAWGRIWSDKCEELECEIYALENN